MMHILKTPATEHLVREQFSSLARFMPLFYGVLLALDANYVFYSRGMPKTWLQYALIVLIAAIAVRRAFHWRNAKRNLSALTKREMTEKINQSTVFAIIVCLAFVVATQGFLDAMNSERKIVMTGLVLTSAIAASFHLAIVPRVAIPVIMATFLPIVALFLSTETTAMRDAALPVMILGASQIFIIARQFRNFEEIVESREALKLAQARLEAAEQAARAQAQTDSLTGLLNRRYFDALAEAPADARIAVALIDLDGFKALNDKHGHLAGDMLLKPFAGRLYEHLHHLGDIVRLGGDEFALVCRKEELFPLLHDALKAAMVELSRPYLLVGTSASVGASVGVAIGTRDQGLLAVTSAADRALYAVKRSGKGFVKTTSVALEDVDRAA